MKLSKIILGFCVLAALGTSCVSQKEYNELLKRQQDCTNNNKRLTNENQQYKIDLRECTASSERLERLLNQRTSELDSIRRDYLICSEELSNLQESYAKIDSKYKSSVSGKNLLAKELSDREAELKEKEKLLAEKEKKVNELQSILDRKEKEMNALKELVSKALLGFQDKGLSVFTKNGKVYVSMDEKLLFASGSWAVGAQGREALAEVSNILAENPDIHVLVEGHTDDVPLKGKGDVKDNWDLSVLRATSIVKILLQNSNVKPEQLAASGRGEYQPIVANDSKENRAKNRRTEIILTPKLDELFQILD